MVASSLNYMVIFLLVVNGYLFVTTHATPTLVEKVCNKTTDKNFCLNVFRSDPATRTASLPGLGQIAIAQAIDEAVKTKADINERLFFASGPKLKVVLTYSLHAYDHALAALQIAPIDLRKRRYMVLYRHADIATENFVSCEQAFIKTSLPSPLTRAKQQLGDDCNIVEIIAIIASNFKK